MKKNVIPCILMGIISIAGLIVGVYCSNFLQISIQGDITIMPGKEVTVYIYKESISQENFLAGAYDGGKIKLDICDLLPNSEISEGDATTVVLVFSTEDTENYIIDTETIEYFDGTTTSGDVIEDAILVKKSHTFTAIDDCGLACFTNDNDYIIECTFTINTNNGFIYSVDFNLNVDIYTSETFPGFGVNGVDYLNFGEYPQTKLQNQDTISSLTDTGEFFSADDSSKVNSIFLDDNNNRYVKIDSCSDTGEPGYFLIEPIKWYILSQENGQTFLQSSVIVDAVAFMKNYVISEDLVLAGDEDGNIITPNANDGDGDYIYVNNYKYSNL